MGGITLGAAAVILVITLIVSIAGLSNPRILERALFRPYWIVRGKERATFITSGFMHADGGHLLFNMLTYFFFALPLERDIGSVWFVVLYFGGLIASHLGTLYKQRDNPDYSSVGASGAISAVLFAYIVFHPDARLAFLLIPIPIPAPLFAVGYLAYSWYASRYSRGRINHDAHLGGAIAGLVFVALIAPDAYRYLLRNLF